MNSEKVKEIKKALENCQKNNCLDCPYFIDEKSCRANDLLLDTITLINELESENEKLKEYIKGNEADAKAFVNGWHKDLKKELELFAERLKEKASRSIMNSDGEIVYIDYDFVITNDIDETLKEFLK